MKYFFTPNPARQKEHCKNGIVRITNDVDLYAIEYYTVNYLAKTYF